MISFVKLAVVAVSAASAGAHRELLPTACNIYGIGSEDWVACISGKKPNPADPILISEDQANALTHGVEFGNGNKIFSWSIETNDYVNGTKQKETYKNGTKTVTETKTDKKGKEHTTTYVNDELVKESEEEDEDEALEEEEDEALEEEEEAVPVAPVIPATPYKAVSPFEQYNKAGAGETPSFVFGAGGIGAPSGFSNYGNYAFKKRGLRGNVEAGN